MSSEPRTPEAGKDDFVRMFEESLSANQASELCVLCHAVTGPEMSSMTIKSVEGNVNIFIEGMVSDIYFITLPIALRNAGVKKVELLASGWWIGDSAPPEEVVIGDHIACHSPNILTGTLEAKTGKAFIDMKNAYESGGGDSYLMWHIASPENVTEDEIQIAKDAGCSVMSPSIACWAVGCIAAGIKISAKVVIENFG